MLQRVRHQNTAVNRLISLGLVFVLLFAAAHVPLHDMDIGGGEPDGHGECQVCRVNHVPAAFLPVPSVPSPPQVHAYQLPAGDTDYTSFRPSHTRWARAPPLS